MPYGHRDERPRGVIVKVLDMSRLEAEALELRQKTHPDCYKAKIYGGEVAIVHNERTGELTYICTEGVGYEVTVEEPLELEFHGNYRVREESQKEDLLGRNVPGEIKTGTETFDMFPFASFILNPDQLLSYPVKEEQDLADFIRVFGSRLESNFWLWFNALSK